MPSLSRRRFLETTAASVALAAVSARLRAAAGPASGARELKCDVLVVGGSFGGVAAALAAARMGRSVIVTEETTWIGGQATCQAVPLDEHPWIEDFGRTRGYAEFRTRVRDYYRRHYPLSDAARADPLLNPGAAWVTALAYEPRVGLAVLHEMLAPHLSSGAIRILLRHRAVAAEMAGDRCRAITLLDEERNTRRTVAAAQILDATELGDLLLLAKIEHVIGAESQAETGEPNALEGAANPRDQMGYTHTIAFDHRPGEDHTIPRPPNYDRWRRANKFRVPDLFGVKQDYFGRLVTPGGYVAAPWSFRRMLCASNFAPGAFASDVTVPIWSSNEYHEGVLMGVSEEEQRRAFEGARQLSLSLLHWLQTEAPDPATGRTGFPGLRARGDVFGTEDGLAPYPYIRESRRIRAEFTVKEQDFRTDLPGTKEGPVKYRDSIGVGGYRIDIHKPAKREGQGKGSMTEALHGKHWCQQVPLGSLIPVRVENILPACKNLGVTSVINGAFRLHPVEWNIGEAAGALAAFALARGSSARAVRNTPALLADYQRELVRQGVELDWPAGFRETSRSYYSHHNLEIKDAPTFYFGEAWRLKGGKKS